MIELTKKWAHSMGWVNNNTEKRLKGWLLKKKKEVYHLPTKNVALNLQPPSYINWVTMILETTLKSRPRVEIM